MNPRAAINDLHPFQGCPFSHLGYFSMHRMYALRIILMSIKVDADICRIFTAVYSIILSWRRYLQRRGWDSNPRALADKRFSRPPRYDHFDTSPYSVTALLLVLFLLLFHNARFIIANISILSTTFCKFFSYFFISSHICPFYQRFRTFLPDKKMCFYPVFK